jgi:hypothetical protein
MMRYLIGIAAAAVIATGTAMSAQETATDKPSGSTSTTTSPSASAQQGTAAVTVEGCLRREQDVPGRSPNVVERAGVQEDFILTDTKMVKGSAPAAARAGAASGATAGSSGSTTAPGGSTAPAGGATASTQQARPTGTAGSTAAMYEVDGLSDDMMKQHAGRRVQIDGNFETLGNDTVEPGDLLDLEATAIRPVAGECSPK